MTVKREEYIFNGRTYRRYPDSDSRSDRDYFRTHGWRGRPSFLHRDVWEHHHGPIPTGHHIHHADEDPGNNDIANLECIDGHAHHKHHHEVNRDDPEWLKERRSQMDHARTFAAEWHGSEEGRAWHREHGKKTWENREPKPATCTHCGGNYEGMIPRDFCSNKCRAAARRASGVDDVDRTCVTCGSTFRVNKYSKSKNCSRKCGAKSSGLAKAGKPITRRTQLDLTCQWCGSAFTATRKAKYCCDNCRGKAAYARKKK